MPSDTDQSSELVADLESLLSAWRGHIAKYPPVAEFSRGAGYFAGLSVCADQLENTLKLHRHG